MEKAASKQRKQRDQASMAQTLSGYAACAQGNTRKWKCEGGISSQGALVLNYEDSKELDSGL